MGTTMKESVVTVWNGAIARHKFKFCTPKQIFRYSKEGALYGTDRLWQDLYSYLPSKKTPRERRGKKSMPFSHSFPFIVNSPQPSWLLYEWESVMQKKKEGQEYRCRFLLNKK